MRTRTAAGPVMPPREMIRTFGPFLRPVWPAYLLAVVLAIVVTGIGLLKPWPLKYLFDKVLVPEASYDAADVDTILLLIVLALAGIAILDSVTTLLRDYVLTAVGERISAEIRTALYSHLQSLSLSFHQSMATGELTTRLTGDVEKVRALLTGTLISATGNILTLAGMTGVLLVLDWQLSVGLLVVLPLLVLTVTSFRARIKAVEEHSREVEGDLAAAAQESLTAIKLVKSLGRERHESARFGAKSHNSMQAILKATRTTSGFSLALDVVVAVATAALVWLGAQRVVSGALTPGDLIIFTSYLRDFFGPTRSLSKLPAQLARAGVRAARIADILEREPAIVDRPDAIAATPPRQELRLDDVTFAYEPGRPVLKDVDLTIPVGQTLAIVGPTGAGKSTIAALLCRLQDPTSGRVLMDGVDLRDVTGESLHAQVGLVLQEAQLFRASVRENIAYPRPRASLDEIVEAARVALAHDFITALPHGYDTVLAERGASLSGGQRQRIALARAVLHGAPVLVLDEPTTGLDARSEHAVLRALERVGASRTVVVITHRMAAAMTADDIVVLDGGLVVEHGNHEALWAAGGLYAEMCRIQGLGDTTDADLFTGPPGRHAADLGLYLPPAEQLLADDG
ncbi:ABC transporter ATP-binding protein/permease [Nocardioides sp. WL0053]|uniref:ABC transporter ATP-binding protein/permease n=1 Tax=Nocardioides jiangsuensis TaxID=2866161 RepID=A0ABS7RK94_9ACTN|nr:ABC transporter ATP-binding protein [Nocardioides jiangsuensis]MBY9073987.1 ABC transporter ATP-binding protein/permease [Nocardioides jiangsuensis]